MNRKTTLPGKSGQLRRKSPASQQAKFPAAQPTQQNPIIALQSVIGNQAVQRLLNRVGGTPAVQRVQEINEDVIVNGELAVMGGAVSANSVISMGRVIGQDAFFNGEVIGSKFTPNGAPAGTEGAATTGAGGESAAPAAGGSDLTSFGLGSP